MKLSTLIGYLAMLWGSLIVILWRFSQGFPLGVLLVMAWMLGFITEIATIFLIDFYETRGEKS